MNPLFGNINQPRQSSPKPKPKTPAEVAAAMLQAQGQSVGAQIGAQAGKPFITGQSVGAQIGAQAGKPFLSPQANTNTQMVVKPAIYNDEENVPPVNHWIDHYYDLAQSGYGGGVPPGTVINGPGGVITTGKDKDDNATGQSTTTTTDVSVKPKPPNPLAIAANLAVPAAIGYGTNQLLGGGGVPAAPDLIGGSFVSPSPAVSPGLSEASFGGFTPPQVGGFPLPIPGNWWDAPAGTDAAALGSNISSGLEYLGVGGETAGAVGSGLGTAIPVAGGLYGGYNLAQNLLDNKKDPAGGASAGAATGAAIGSFVPIPGATLIGAGLGALVGGGLGMIGGDKGEDQLARDQIRAALLDAGVIDDGYNLTLADGSKYDIGKDGSIQNYNVDFSEENVGDLVASANPLAALITGGDPKLRSDFAGYFTNAAKSSGDPLENIKKIYADAGFNHDSAYGGILKLVEEKKISKEEGDAYLNGLDQLFGVGAYGEGKQEAKESGGGKGRKKEEASEPAAPAPVAPQPPPTVGEPSGTQPVSLQDYVDAIVAVNQANQSEDQAAQMMKLMKMKNPLYGNIL